MSRRRGGNNNARGNGNRAPPGGRRLTPAPNTAPNQPNIMQMIQRAVQRAIAGSGTQQKSTLAPFQRRVNPLMMRNAATRSIPKTILPKLERFVHGAPSTVSLAPRGHGHYDAFARKPETMVLASQVGPCTLVEGYGHTIVRGLPPVDGVFDIWSQGPLAGTTGPGSYGTYHTSPVTGNPTIIVFNPGASTEHVANIYQLKNLETTNGTRVVATNEPLRCSALSGIGGGAIDLSNPLITAEVQQMYSGGSAVSSSSGSVLGIGGVTGAAESIPIRGSIRIRNITEHRNVGGDVRIMRYNGSLNLFGHADAMSTGHNQDGFIAQNGAYSTKNQQWNWDATTQSTSFSVPDLHSRSITVENFLEIVDMMRDSSRSKPMSGHDLVVCHQTNTYPADFVRAHTFRYDDDFIETVNTPKYNSVIILIDDFSPSTGEGTGAAPNNTYSITCQVQRAARFKPGTLLHNKATTLRANAASHSSASLAESLASYATPVKDLAEAAFMASRSKLAEGVGRAMSAEGAAELASLLV